MKIFVYCLMLLSTVSGFSQFIVPIVEEAPHVYVIESGMSFTEDIIVPDGAKLLLENGEFFQFAEGTGITVENGGQLMIQNATLGAINDSWKGISILPDPTFDYEEVHAVIIENSIIKDADIGIFNAPMYGTKVRNVFARNSTFSDNYSHIQGGSVPGDLFNNSSVYGTVYDNCTFTLSSGFYSSNWPILLFTPANYKFKQCTFNYLNSSSEIGIHADYPNNLILDGCNFKRTGEIGATFHFIIEDVEVVNCTFENGYKGASEEAAWQDEFTSYEYIGLLVGGKGGSTVESCLIQNNTFVNDKSIKNDCGVYVFPNTKAGTYGRDVIIEENSFTNLGTGVHTRECMLGSSEITNNGFFDCYKGIVSGENNYALELTCNSFVNGSRAIEIHENSELPPHNTFLPNNRFFNSSYDIYNLGTTSFEYAVTDLIAGYQPYDNLNVDLTVNNVLKVRCQPKKRKKNKAPQTGSDGEKNLLSHGHEFDLEVYPNPANETLNIRIDGRINTDTQIQLTDLTGKILYTATSPESKIAKIDVSGYTRGVYLVVIKSGNYQELKKVVLQ